MRTSLLRTERNLSRIRMDARKADTRRKIELGGLVIKSGLANEDPAVIFGALSLAVKALNGSNGEGTRLRFQSAGSALFEESAHVRK